jgi:GAF domain-containing protein
VVDARGIVRPDALEVLTLHTNETSAAEGAEHRVVVVLDYLASILEAPAPVHDPRRLAVAVAGGVPNAGGVGVIAGCAGTWRSLASTARAGAVLDHRQCLTAAGPSVEAVVRAMTIRADRAALRERWPVFAKPAEAEGIRSCLAMPVTLGERQSGAVTLYGTSPTGFSRVEEALLRAATAAVSRTVADAARTREARERADHMHLALASRAVIDQAKGLLMALHGIDADAAFAMLSRMSQESNIKLHTVARNLVDTIAPNSPNPALPSLPGDSSPRPT